MFKCPTMQINMQNGGGGGFDCLFGHTVHGGFLSPGEEESRSGGGTRREARPTMSC